MEINIQKIFKEYSQLYQFEEGSPEYLIDKKDFSQAIKEIVEAVLLEAAENGYSLDWRNAKCEIHKDSITSVINKVKF